MKRVRTKATTQAASEEEGEGPGRSRSVWTGSLSFGLLNIPVSLFGSKEGDTISFSLLDKRDHAHIGYRQFNKTTGRVVPPNQIVKGYEYRSGEYVIVTDEDFKHANPHAYSSVDIEDFVDLADVDPMLFDRPYYLAPAKNGEKGYRLLREVMERTKKAAVGKVVLFRKQRLVTIFPRGDYLVLEVLRFAREVLTVDEMPGLASRLNRVKVSPREVEMAEALVSGMTVKWRPEKYDDTYHHDLMKFVKEKVKRGRVVEVEEVPKDEKSDGTGAEIVDLMPLLKKSLEAGKRSRSRLSARG